MFAAARLGILGAVSAALLASAPAIANPVDARPETAPARVAPSIPRLFGSDTGMSFRLVEGRGPFGLTRWIQASGEIQLLTGLHFRIFAHNLQTAGLTVALDSPGGSVDGGLALGRALRAAGVNTTIGRTVTRREGGSDVATLVTHNARCYSACTYGFLAGVERRIAPTAMFGVHQFTNPALMTSSTPEQAFRHAQHSAATIVVFLQEIGADLRIFALASSQATGMRDLTAAEHRDLGTATVSVVEAQNAPVGWSIAREGAPMLYRREVRLASEPMRIDQEVFAFCRDPQIFTLQVRFILARGRADHDLSVDEVRLEVGAAALEWRRPQERRVALRNENGSAWLNVQVPREAFLEAARSGRLTVTVPGATGLSGTIDIAEGLAEAAPDLAAACDARRERELARRAGSP